MTDFNVLLVEDDEVDILTVKKSFEKAKIANPLYVAKDGIHALEMLKSVPKPVVILLDLNLPRMSGIEMLRKLRESGNNTVTIVLTTSKDEGDKVDAYKLGVGGYIIKPVEANKIVNAMSLLNAYWKCCELPE